MRDPFSWSFPLGRLFGIVIRVHVLFPILALAMIVRISTKPVGGQSPPDGIWLDALAVIGILFLSVLLHEFGHCFAARSVEGDAQEILMWPLGGLAAVEVPHTWRANFITAAGGPAVNLLLCGLSAGILAALSFVPPLNPWSDPYRPSMYNWAAQTEIQHPRPWIVRPADGPESHERPTVKPAEPEGRTLTHGEIFLARFFYVNWFLLLLNLLPGFPLDGGRMLQCLLWWRGDYRQATITAIYTGFVVMIIIGIYGIVIDSVLPLLLAAFIFSTCRHQWFVLETGGEENLFGYDFSQGYTSLERDQPAPAAPRRRQPNFFQRWLQKRAQKKMQREQETREAEERRMDELLEKVQQQGLQALTEEERRFLTRVSARYRNRN